MSQADRNDWRAGCSESCTPGSVGGFPKSAFSGEVLDFTLDVSRGEPTQHVEGKLDLNQHLVRHPASTYYVRVVGDSMIGCGIHSGDLLIVDKSLEATDGRVVIAVLNGELTVKRLCCCNEGLFLVAANPNYPPLEVNEAMEFQIWGVVTGVFHPL